MKQFEDNATKSLALILNHSYRAKKKLIFDFLVQHHKEKFKFENFDSAETHAKLNGSIPDLILHFSGTDDVYRIEVKDKDSQLTDSERDRTNRDVFLIPKDYSYEKDIPVVEKIYWEDLFEQIDDEFDGLQFEELKLTRHTLGIERGKFMTLDTYKARLFEIFSRLEAINPSFKVDFDNENNDITHYEKDDDGWNIVYFDCGTVFTNDTLKDAEIGCHFWFGNEEVYIAFGNNKKDDYFSCYYDDLISAENYEDTNTEYENNYSKFLMSTEMLLEDDIDEVVDFFNVEVHILQTLLHKMNSRTYISRFKCPKRKIAKDVVIPEMKKLAEKLGLEFKNNDFENGCYWGGLEFHIPEIDNFMLTIEMDKDLWADMIYGIKWVDGESREDRDNLTGILDDSDKSNVWPSWKYFDDEDKNWNVTYFQQIEKDPQKFSEKIEDAIQECLAALRKKKLIK